MANSQNVKIVSIVLIVLGAALLFWGFQMSGAVGNQVTETLTGSSSDAVMARYIGGAISLAVGVYLFLKK